MTACGETGRVLPHPEASWDGGTLQGVDGNADRLWTLVNSDALGWVLCACSLPAVFYRPVTWFAGPMAGRGSTGALIW